VVPPLNPLTLFPIEQVCVHKAPQLALQQITTRKEKGTEHTTTMCLPFHRKMVVIRLIVAVVVNETMSATWTHVHMLVQPRTVSSENNANTTGTTFANDTTCSCGQLMAIVEEHYFYNSPFILMMAIHKIMERMETMLVTRDTEALLAAGLRHALVQAMK
jgi:hypothetical protein